MSSGIAYCISAHCSLHYACCRFCWPCITQWSDRETRCPLCKKRFQTIKRKAVYFGDPHAKRRKLNPGSATANAAADEQATPSGGPSTPSEFSAAATAAAGAAGADAGDGSVSDDSSSPESPKGRLEGVVLETKRVQQRDQVCADREGAVQRPKQSKHKA